MTTVTTAEDTRLANAKTDLEVAQRKLDDATARRAVVEAKEAEVVQQLATAPDWNSFADARERDREHDRQLHLVRQLELLRAGHLRCAPDAYYEPLTLLDAHVRDLTARRDRAQSALDALLR